MWEVVMAKLIKPVDLKAKKPPVRTPSAIKMPKITHIGDVFFSNLRLTF
jgi:hypothetical protein